MSLLTALESKLKRQIAARKVAEALLEQKSLELFEAHADPNHQQDCHPYHDLQVYTNKPAIQLYTGNFLTGNPGHNGEVYQAHSGVALETQFLPDSPNRPDWPHQSCWLKPGERYQYQTCYRLYQPNP